MSGAIAAPPPVGVEELALPPAGALRTLYRRTRFAGGIAFTADNVQLRLPDGTKVSPRPDGHSQSIELIGPGKTVKGMTSRFEIPDGLTGKFALLILDGSSVKAIPFSIGP